MYMFIIVFGSTLRLTVLGLEWSVCIPSLGKGMPRDDYH